MNSLLENLPGSALALVLALALSFLMSGMEAGVFALSRLRIRQAMRKGERGARVLHQFLEDPEDFLWTILVGNTIANFVVMGLSLKLLYGALRNNPVWFLSAFLLLVFAFYSIADLLPKMLFRLFPTRLCLALALPFRWIHAALSPFVAVAAWFSQGLLRWTGGRTFTGRLFGDRAELQFVMQESAGTLSTEERSMIARVLDLQNRRVAQIAVPLSRVTMVSEHTPMSDVLRLCQDSGFSRVPVWRDEGGRRRIVGVISLKTVLYLPDLDPARTAGDYVKPALYLSDDMRLEEALRRMQRSGQRLAIVLGADQRETGVVTLEDILKTIFGDVSL